MTGESIEELEQKAKDLAIASMAVSISCIPMTFGTLSFIGAILGHMSLRRLKAVGNTSHIGFATAGIIVGYVSTVIAFLAIFGAIVFILFSY